MEHFKAAASIVRISSPVPLGVMGFVDLSQMTGRQAFPLSFGVLGDLASVASHERAG